MKRKEQKPQEEESSYIKQNGSYTRIPDIYWKKDWYIKRPTYKLVFDYLTYQAKWAKQGKSIGNITIGTRQLSKILNIPFKTIHNILKFLEKQGELLLRSTTEFTYITVVHLVNNKKMTHDLTHDLTHENFLQVIDKQYTYKDTKKNLTHDLTHDLTLPIDKIDIIDNLVEENFNEEMITKK